MLTIDAFLKLCELPDPPLGLSPELLALWHDYRGDWEQAHILVQDSHSPSASLVHAYLHRKEGDRANARYWYREANRTVPKTSISEEWSNLVSELFAKNA